jgi:hypothetical protein
MGGKKDQTILIPITIQTWESVLNYLISTRVVYRPFLRNIRRLIGIINRRPYETDDYKMFVINAIEYVSDVRYDGISNLNSVKLTLEQSGLDINYINHLYGNLATNSLDFSKEEYDHLSIVIKEYTEYSYLYQHREKILSLFDELMAPSFHRKALSNVVTSLKDDLESLLSNIRKSGIQNKDSEYLCIGAHPGEEMDAEINRLYDEITNPSNTFKTGLKELNRFLDGGFKRKQTTVFYGPPSNFKSGILLYAGLWIIQFNPNVQSKSPNKKVAVVLITMECTCFEEMDRIFSIYTSGDVDARTISHDQYCSQWSKIFSQLNDKFNLYIIYKSPITTTANDIQSSVEQLEEDENCEVVAVIIDHLGNIKKTDKSVDDRKGLIETTYELSDWGKTTDRAMIMAMHTNSTLDTALAEAIESGKNNLIRMFGRHYIAESKYVDKAIDLSIYIVKEYSHITRKWYLGFKYEKRRQRKSARSNENIFYHELENEIVLAYDEGLDKCKSFPCIPGTEGSLQPQQQRQPQSVPHVNRTSPFMSSGITQPPQVYLNSYVQPDVTHQMPPFQSSYQHILPTQVAMNTPVTIDLESDDDDGIIYEYEKDDSDEILRILERLEDSKYNDEEDDLAFTDEDFVETENDLDTYIK